MSLQNDEKNFWLKNTIFQMKNEVRIFLLPAAILNAVKIKSEGALLQLCICFLVNTI